MDSPTKTGLEISEDSHSFEEVSSDHNASSSPVTPKSERIQVAFNFDNGSSDVSPNHESDSSYSELDSEAEAFYSSLNHQLVSQGEIDGLELAEKPMSYAELLKKVVQCEEEVRTTSLKLQESELEIEKLKGEAEMRGSTGVLAENLRAELEAAQREIEMRDIEIKTEKSRVLEMQRQVVDLESKLSDSSFKIENLVNELEESDAEISKLKEMLCDRETEKAKLETDIADVLETQTLFEARIKEIEARSEVLENLIRQSDAEILEMKSKEVNLQADIDALKKDLESRDERIEAVNKDFDKHKLSFDMLMGEKDGVCAELDNLKAEMRSKDIQIEQMRHKETELVTESGHAKNTAEELRAMVKELEKQVELQRNMISEGEEEKREAIRQLCFTLGHYKSGYRQLLRFLSSNNNQQEQAIMVV